MDGVATPAGLSPCLAHCRSADITSGKATTTKINHPPLPPSPPPPTQLFLPPFSFAPRPNHPSRVFSRETVRERRRPRRRTAKRVETRFLSSSSHVLARIDLPSASIRPRAGQGQARSRPTTYLENFIHARSRAWGGRVETLTRNTKRRSHVAIVAWLAPTENVRDERK